MRKCSSFIVLILAALLIMKPFPAIAGEGGIRTLRFILVPERNIFRQEEKYRKLCDYLCSHLSPVKVLFEVAKSYEEVMSQMEDGRAQGGVLGSFLAVHGMEKHGFVPLVRPVWLSGDSYYRSYVFKKTGSGLTRDISTWKGKSIAMANRSTSAGFFFPMALVKTGGIDDPEAFFSKLFFTGSHDASIWMVAKGLADLGAAKNTVFDETMKIKPELGGQVEILYSGGHFPDDTVTVIREVPSALREKIIEVFLHMDATAEGREVLKRFGARRFIPSPPADYADVIKIVKAGGFDLQKLKVVEHAVR